MAVLENVCEDGLAVTVVTVELALKSTGDMVIPEAGAASR